MAFMVAAVPSGIDPELQSQIDSFFKRTGDWEYVEGFFDNTPEKEWVPENLGDYLDAHGEAEY